MGTENDRFGQRLGRGFKRIWGGLAAGHDVADQLVTYIDRTFHKDDAEIDPFCRSTMAAIDAFGGLLLRDLALDDKLLEREGTRSHAAMHAADAYRDAILRCARREDYPLLLARRLFDTVVNLARIRGPYAHDEITFDRLHAQREVVTARLANKLKRCLGLPSEVRPRTTRVVSDQKIHLDSPIGYIA